MAYGAGSEGQWEDALNRAWQELSPKQREELRQDERDWIKWQNSLPPEPAYNATKNRALYIQKIQAGEKISSDHGWSVNPDFDYPTGKLSPHDAQERVDDINAEEKGEQEAKTATIHPLYSNEQATQLINAIQQTKNKPPVRSGVTYDAQNDTYNWIGPEKGRPMSSPRTEFEKDVGPIAYRLGIEPTTAATTATAPRAELAAQATTPAPPPTHIADPESVFKAKPTPTPGEGAIQISPGAREWITKRLNLTPEQLEQGIKEALQKAQDILDSNQPIDWGAKIWVFDSETLDSGALTELLTPNSRWADEPYFRHLEQYAHQGDQLRRDIEQRKEQFAQQQRDLALATAPTPNQQTKVPQDIITGWKKELSDFWLHPYYHQATSLKFDSVDYGTPMKSSIGFTIGDTGHISAGTTIYPVRIQITLSGTDGKGGGSRPVSATRYFCQDSFGNWLYLDKLPAGV
jgi:hypothetical protein